MSLLITNGKVLFGGELIDTDILIEDGKIQEVGNSLSAEQVLDVQRNIVIPGLIDSHVHFCEPGYEQKEDFYTGSCAAVAGGVTTILDMPNTNPPTLSHEALELKRKLAQKSIVNYGFHFGSTGYNISEIEKVRNVASTSVYFDEYHDMMAIRAIDLLENIFLCSKIITCHATEKNVKTALRLSTDTSTDTYLCSISTREEIEMVMKHSGLTEVHVEVTPHHLFLTRQYEDMLQAFALVHPRLNYKVDHEALWQAINSNLVSTIASAHTPHTVKEKHSSNPPYGIPGVETMLPLLLNAVNDRKLSLAKLVQLTSTNPAQIFRLRNKGEIRDGFDADLTVVDMKLIREVNNEKLHYKCGWTPYNGFNLRGWPVTTIVNGNIVFHNGKIYNQFRGQEVEYAK